MKARVNWSVSWMLEDSYDAYVIAPRHLALNPASDPKSHNATTPPQPIQASKKAPERPLHEICLPKPSDFNPND